MFFVTHAGLWRAAGEKITIGAALIPSYMRRSRWNSRRSALVNLTATVLAVRLLKAAAICSGSPS
jgi:hypothetical protein